METEGKVSVREGEGLLGDVQFADIGNGRLRCVETGHELLSKDLDLYRNSKGCRLALIDHALSLKKPPLNFFEQSALCKGKLICQLTGHMVNKSEEHIWKHISGKKFQNKLAQKEAEKNLKGKDGKKTRKDYAITKKIKNTIENAVKVTDTPSDNILDPFFVDEVDASNALELKTSVKDDMESGNANIDDDAWREAEKSSKEMDENSARKNYVSTKKRKNKIDNGLKSTENHSDDNCVAEAEAKSSNDSEASDFWVPPVGERWDNDAGQDRWEVVEGCEVDSEDQEGIMEDDNVNSDDEWMLRKNSEATTDLTLQTKRMSIEAVGPSSFATQKKKKKYYASQFCHVYQSACVPSLPSSWDLLFLLKALMLLGGLYPEIQDKVLF